MTWEGSWGSGETGKRSWKFRREAYGALAPLARGRRQIWGGGGNEWEGVVSRKPTGADVVWVLQGSRSRGRKSWGLRKESTLTSGRDRKTDARGESSRHSHIRMALSWLHIPLCSLPL